MKKEKATGFQEEQESIGRKIYKSLMNGVSHMLPFVIGGGILIALSFLFDGANAGTDVFGTGNPLSKFLNLVGNVSFGMMFPILSGYIAMSIAERPALMLVSLVVCLRKQEHLCLRLRRIGSHPDFLERCSPDLLQDT